jgi:hypothetical protein
MINYLKVATVGSNCQGVFNHPTGGICYRGIVSWKVPFHAAAHVWFNIYPAELDLFSSHTYI